MSHEEFIHELRNIITIEKLRTYRLQERLADMKKGWELEDTLRSLFK